MALFGTSDVRQSCENLVFSTRYRLLFAPKLKCSVSEDLRIRDLTAPFTNSEYCFSDVKARIDAKESKWKSTIERKTEIPVGVNEDSVSVPNFQEWANPACLWGCLDKQIFDT